jgi:hypothetical protein
MDGESFFHNNENKKKRRQARNNMVIRANLVFSAPSVLALRQTE